MKPRVERVVRHSRLQPRPGRNTIGGFFRFFRLASPGAAVTCALFLALPAPALADETNPLLLFQEKEARLFETGFLLASGNAAFCEEQKPELGLLLHDAKAYGDPDRVRSLLGLTGDIGVQAVASGSPADLVGLKQNHSLVSIDGMDVNAPIPEAWEDWRRAQFLNEKLDRSARDDKVTIGWRGNDGIITSAEISPVKACVSKFELLSRDRGASADGQRVLIGENFPGFSYSDGEFAAAVAHEMAHNILRHLAYFDQHGSKQSVVRLSERDADRLMPWLLANAGFDPADAVKFMARYGPRHGGWIFRKRTHDGWDERVELIEAELAIIEKARADHPQGLADWSKYFTQYLGPDSKAE